MTSQLMVESRNDRAENAWGLGWGNLSFGSVKGSKGLTDEFYGFIKSRKRFIFVIGSYSKDKAFTAVKRDEKL